MSKDFKRFDSVAYRNTVMDGLTEIAIGLFLLLLAVALPFGPYALLVYLAPLAFIPALRFMQRRFTHPRIGFVEPATDKPAQILPLIVLFTLLVLGVTLAILVLTSGGFAKPDYPLLARRLYFWNPALMGFLTACGLWYAASRSGLKRFGVFAIVSLVLGFALPIFGILRGTPVVEGKLGGMQVFLGAMGALSLLSGLIVFVRFLHRHPVQSPELTDVRH